MFLCYIYINYVVSIEKMIEVQREMKEIKMCNDQINHNRFIIK